MKTLGKKVVIKPDEFEKETTSGIIVEQDAADKMKHTKGVVTAVGSEVKDVAVGDHIMYSPLMFDEVETDGETFHVVDEDDVYLILD